MAVGTVALLGNLAIDRNLFDSIASEFDLTVEPVPTLRALSERSAAGDVVAVLFDARVLGLSWSDALEGILGIAPGILPVVYAGFSESIRWPELSEAGAFHILRRPINESETRHTLGFIWAAKRWDQPQKKLAVGESSRTNSHRPAVAVRQ